jgi:hypothetical protein
MTTREANTEADFVVAPEGPIGLFLASRVRFALKQWDLERDAIGFRGSGGMKGKNG